MARFRSCNLTTLVAATHCLLVPAVAGAQPPEPQPPVLEEREVPRSAVAEDPLVWTPGGLTSDEAAKKAVAASPTVAARQAELEAANARVAQAMIQFLPRVGVKATYARISFIPISIGGASSVVGPGGGLLATPGPEASAAACQSGSPAAGVTCLRTDSGGVLAVAPFQFASIPVLQDTYTLAATLAVPISDYVLRLSKTIGATRANKRASQLIRQAEELKAATDARIAYYNWTRGVASVTVAEAALVRIYALQRDTQAAFTVGTATQADVLRVDALAASTELTITETRNLRELAAEQLSVLMNEPRRDYRVGENVRAELAGARETGSLPGLIREAFRRRLEIRALGETERSLDKAADATRLGEYPRLDGFGEYDYARPNRFFIFDPATWHSNWTVGMTLSYTVNDTLANAASAREIEANRRKVKADMTNLKRGLRMEVTSAYLDQQKASVSLAAAQRGLRSAREAYRVATDLYRVGRATTTELIAAEQELLVAALREINAAIDGRVAWTNLRHSTGFDVGERP